MFACKSAAEKRPPLALHHSILWVPDIRQELKHGEEGLGVFLMGAIPKD